MSADTSDLDGLARSFRAIPALMVPKLKGVVAKSALNTKKIMQADARKSRHFKQLSRAISFDLKVYEFGGDGVIEAEIGPTTGGAGSLAGIAYFGTSKPGGGTVRNPEDAMLEEAPNFYEYAFKATEGLL
ncbi:hypothetical protein NIBR502772_06100 [Pseudarthrobacter sp. NIBRBAC000502772]|uniref:hypothetical protein n=1 Tax=Pseudarthrobacter sp. NIBRBAC000502772 TaxID=2590775 RepID=UPI001130BB11|nr:hypothetical protein [Pseudarthrobacter sp. NIBRBAC000502772]QDG65844.1 hypothetical protein NIBR502772_06100 [Pseudarthrobacter sp. NIBRBAC000502772]